MNRILIIGLWAVALACAIWAPVGAQNARALSHLGSEGASIEDAHGAVVITVPMTQAVPWRVFTIDNPPRLIVEFEELVFSEQPRLNSASFLGVQAGKSALGVSRIVAVLREPLQVTEAEMTTTEDGATLSLRLMPTTAEDFRENAEPPEPAVSFVENSAQNDLPKIVVDPGHGGLDPGAEAKGLREADLMLDFALRLQRKLNDEGNFSVVLTRETDVFVPLRDRLRFARASGADVFLSLHADSLAGEDGQASGMTVYTLGEGFASEADRKLAEHHAHSEILAGADLTGVGDDVAVSLLEISRRDVTPRSKALSQALIRAVERAGLKINSRAERQGDFAVLRSADFPSVLVELGFLSSEEERERLISDAWQDEAANAIVEALILWADEDQLRQKALRK